MTRALVCGFVLFLGVYNAVPAFAQSQAAPSRGPVSSFDELWMKVKSGDVVYVLDTSARETTGTFAKVSQSSMELLVDGQIREIPLSDIRQVARRGDTLWNGALIGAAFGAVVGVAAGSADTSCLGTHCSSFTGTDRAAFFLIGAGVYGAVGAGIDALIHGRTVVYQSTPQRTVRLVPALSRHQISAQLSVGF